jgi:uncharacterized membrane protein (DUF106 family)
LQEEFDFGALQEKQIEDQLDKEIIMVRLSNNGGVLRKIFLIIFIISTLLFITFWLTGSMVDDVFTGLQESFDPRISQSPPATTTAEGYLAVIGTVLTSAISLVGFITTTAITWRKEKREAALAEVERRKLEIELEKSRLEIERLKEDKAKKNE